MLSLRSSFLMVYQREPSLHLGASTKSKTTVAGEKNIWIGYLYKGHIQNEKVVKNKNIQTKLCWIWMSQTQLAIHIQQLLHNLPFCSRNSYIDSYMIETCILFSEYFVRNLYDSLDNFSLPRIIWRPRESVGYSLRRIRTLAVSGG